MLFPGQAIEVGVAVCTALAAINDIQRVEWELETLGQRFNTSLEFSWLQRRQLVEQRQDKDWIDCDGEDLDDDREQPQIVEELRPCDLNDLEERAQYRCTQRDHQSL